MSPAIKELLSRATISNKPLAMIIFTIVLSLLPFISNANSGSFTPQALKNGINVGPNIGIKAPAISVLNHKGNPETLSKLSGDKGLIILFFRSADWCPYCKKHLIELNQQAKKFTDLGYGLAAISYDTQKVLQDFSTKQAITYPLLADQNAATMLSYDILNKQYLKGDDNYGIPYPGVVVINAKGRVTHKHFFQGYKKRVKFTELYQQLK